MSFPLSKDFVTIHVTYIFEADLYEPASLFNSFSSLNMEFIVCVLEYCFFYRYVN
ncbi:MAG: hypothetical protein QXN96_02985 [Candidatus Bathyarchaeia archaeon]